MNNRTDSANHQSTSEPAGDSADARLVAAIKEFQAGFASGSGDFREALIKKYADIAEFLEPCLDGLSFLCNAAPDRLVLPTDDKSPLQLDDFQMIREIGRGGMGIVYEAEQVSLSRLVAIKIFPMAAILGERQLARFHNEANAAAMLDHRHIVSIYSVGCDKGVHYFAMQLIEGQDLAQVIEELRKVDDLVDGTEMHASEFMRQLTAENLRRSGSGGERQRYYKSVAQLGIEAAKALHYAHQEGVIHRDVKPANLLLDEDGKIYVSDFGLARIEAAPVMTMTGDVMGTLRYMSPEQASGKQNVVDHRTDVYSLGVTLYELVTHHLPFDGDSREKLLKQIAFDVPTAPRRVDPSIPKELETILLKAIERKPEDRYSSAAELADDLLRFVEDRPIAARPVGRVEQTWRAAKRNPTIALLSCLFLMALLLVTFLSLSLAQSAMRNSRQMAISRQRAVELQAKAAAEKSIAVKALSQEQVALRQASLTVKFLAETFQEPLPELSGPNVTLLEVLRSMSDRIVGEFENEPLIAAKLLRQTGLSFLNLNSFREAVQPLKLAAEFYEQELGRYHSETVATTKEFAWACTFAGQASQAAAMYDRLMSEVPKSFENETRKQKMLRGHAYAYARRMKEAIEILEDLVQQEPDYTEGQMRLAEAYSLSGQASKINEVLENYEHYIAGKPVSIESLEHRGMLLSKLRKEELSIPLFEEALKLRRMKNNNESSKNIEGLIWNLDALSFAFAKFNDIPKALVVYEELIPLARQQWGAENDQLRRMEIRYLEAYRRSGQYKKALDLIPSFFPGINIERNPNALSLRGLFYTRIGDWKLASSSYSSALDMDGYKKYYGLYAIPLLLLAEDNKQYETAMKNILHEYPSILDTTTASMLVRLYCLVPRDTIPQTLPIDILEEATGSTLPGFPEQFSAACLALVRYRQGRLKESLSLCDRVLAIDPYFPLKMTIEVQKILILYDTGKLEEARQLLAQVTPRIERFIEVSSENQLKNWLAAEVLRIEAEHKLFEEPGLNPR